MVILFLLVRNDYSSQFPKVSRKSFGVMFSALATLVFVDWLPQVKFFAVSAIISLLDMDLVELSLSTSTSR